MKCFHGLIIALMAVWALPSHAQSLGDTVSEPGLFSYQAPKDWKVTTSAMSKYKVCMGAPQNNFVPNINVVTEKYAKPLVEYVELNKTNLKASPIFLNLQILDQKPFEATTGVKGIRVVVKDTLGKVDMQQIFYFFEEGTDTKLVVTASCSVADGDHYASIFDASMKTFSTSNK